MKLVLQFVSVPLVVVSNSGIILCYACNIFMDSFRSNSWTSYKHSPSFTLCTFILLYSSTAVRKYVLVIRILNYNTVLHYCCSVIS